MKLRKITVMVIMAGLMMLAADCFAQSPEAGYQSYSVSFEQDGKVVNSSRHVVNLQKKDFAIVVKFIGFHGDPVAVRLNAGINDHYYAIAQNKIVAADLLEEGTGMAEPAQILPDIILTNDKAVQYLYIDNNGSRFHETRIDGNVIYGRRYITSVSFQGDSSEIPIQNLMVNEIYLVFTRQGGQGIEQEYFLIQFPKLPLPRKELTKEQWVQQGQEYEQGNDTGRAVEAYTRAAAIDPRYFDAYLMRALAFMRLGRYKEAMADCNTAVAINPRNVDAYHWRANLYTNLGNIEQAIDDYSRIIDIDPSLGAAYKFRGTLYYKEYAQDGDRGHLVMACDDFSRIIALQPDNYGLYALRADIYMKLNNMKGAASDYSVLINADPDNIGYREKRADCYRALGLWGKEWQDRDKLVDMDSQNPAAYANRAIVGLQLKKDMDQVADDFSKQLELTQPPVGNDLLLAIYSGRAQAYRFGGQKDKAIADFSAAIALQPGHAELYHNRGATYFEQGDYDNAITDCGRAIGLYPGDGGNALTYLIRGRAYKVKRMFKEARADFTKALKIDPTLQDAVKELKTLPKP
jgi:tetratricopeptide (TPR) repeat protein